MDTQIIAGIAAILLAIAGLITAVASRIKSSGEVEAVKHDREQTKQERDMKIALLEQECKFLRGRLDEGQDRFDKIDIEVKSMNEKFSGRMETMNEKLTTVITQLNTMISMQKKSHTPENRPL
jgi:predicted nuclease with TOPRIM domain